MPSTRGPRCRESRPDEPDADIHQAALGHTASVRRRSQSRVPALRLLPDPSPAEPRPQPESPRGEDAQPPALRVIAGPTRILLAGADAERRATLLDELSQTLPQSTVFEQADAVCEALEHAPAAAWRSSPAISTTPPRSR